MKMKKRITLDSLVLNNEHCQCRECLKLQLTQAQKSNKPTVIGSTI